MAQNITIFSFAASFILYILYKSRTAPHSRMLSLFFILLLLFISNYRKTAFRIQIKLHFPNPPEYFPLLTVAPVRFRPRFRPRFRLRSHLYFLTSLYFHFFPV